MPTLFWYFIIGVVAFMIGRGSICEKNDALIEELKEKIDEVEQKLDRLDDIELGCKLDSIVDFHLLGYGVC